MAQHHEPQQINHVELQTSRQPTPMQSISKFASLFNMLIVPVVIAIFFGTKAYVSLAPTTYVDEKFELANKHADNAVAEAIKHSDETLRQAIKTHADDLQTAMKRADEMATVNLAKAYEHSDANRQGMSLEYTKGLAELREGQAKLTVTTDLMLRAIQNMRDAPWDERAERKSRYSKSER